jgi:hypothetical protein
MAKDYEDDVSLFEELLKEYEEEEDAEEVGTPVSPDQLPQLQQQMPQSSGGGGGGSNFLNTAMQMGKLAMMFAQDGGQVKKKTKKKKRVVRGVGAAKRGYGKATYSKKMY